MLACYNLREREMEKQQYFTLVQTRYAEGRKGSGVACGDVRDTIRAVVFVVFTHN